MKLHTKNLENRFLEHALKEKIDSYSLATSCDNGSRAFFFAKTNVSSSSRIVSTSGFVWKSFCI